MSAIVSPAAWAASRIAAHIVSSPCCWPFSGSVGRVTWPREWPESSTTPAFIDVPPTSRPINKRGEFIVTSFPSSQGPLPLFELAFEFGEGQRHAGRQAAARRAFAAGPLVADP